MPVKSDIETKDKNPQPNPVIPDIIQEATAITALVTTSQQSAILSNLSMSNSVLQANLAQQNVVGNQRSLGELGVISTAKAARLVRGLGVAEAKASSEYLTSDATAEQIADLKGTIEAFSGRHGRIPPSPSVPPVFLPRNPLGPPYKVVAPIHLTLLNVVESADLNVEKIIGDTQTIVKFTAKKTIPYPEIFGKNIPRPVPRNSQVFGLVPLQLAFDNDHQTKIVEIGDWTAEKVIEITESSAKET